jgi:hypothetical protein
MNLKLFVYKTGKPLSEIKQIADKAIKEAQILGCENDERFVESVLVTLLDMNEEEYTVCIKDLNKKFVESKFQSFDDFLESLLVEDTMMSTAFGLSLRPENMLGATEPDKQKKDDKEKDTKELDKLNKQNVK